MLVYADRARMNRQLNCWQQLFSKFLRLLLLYSVVLYAVLEHIDCRRVVSLILKQYTFEIISCGDVFIVSHDVVQKS